MFTVKRVENPSKYYRLGLTGGGTLRDDRGLAGQGARQARAAVAHWRTRSRQQQDGQISALREASYQVREGEILGIIGRNSPGKRTLRRDLSRTTASI